MVINNPDENDHALVTAGYPDYVRELVWTEEVGKDGTPHIQAYVKLQRSQRMSFIKKLFPRGHFKPCDRDEYNLNTKRYVQKNDATTAGAHRQTYHDPIPAADTLLYKLVEQTLEERLADLTISLRKAAERDYYGKSQEEYYHEIQIEIDTDNWCRGEKEEFRQALGRTEHAHVREHKHVEKLLCSPTYGRIKREWLWDIVSRILKHAYDNARLEQDAGGQVGVIDLPSTIDGSEGEGSSDSNGEDDSDSGEVSEASDSEGD